MELRECELETDEIEAEERFLLPSEVHAVQCDSAGEITEALKLFSNNVGEQVFKDFLGYDPKRKDGTLWRDDHVD